MQAAASVLCSRSHARVQHSLTREARPVRSREAVVPRSALVHHRLSANTVALIYYPITSQKILSRLLDGALYAALILEDRSGGSQPMRAHLRVLLLSFVQRALPPNI